MVNEYQELKMKSFIITDNLKGYKKPQYVGDYYIETVEKKYALYFYNIENVAMMSWYANLSIFSENKFDIPILSSGKVCIWYFEDTTFTYAQKSECLIFIMSFAQSGKPSGPYLFIKPRTGQFSLIDWDVTSLYYSLVEVDENILIVKETSPKDLDRLNYLRRTGEIINLTELIWYDFAQFDDTREIYLNR